MSRLQHGFRRASTEFIEASLVFAPVMKSFLSIEHARNLILIAGSLIFIAVVGFLLSGQWKRHMILQDLPRRLGADIQLQANQFDYTQMRRGKTLFRIHAERAEQTRKSGETMLHNVRIEFFTPEGQPEDTIRGDEFQYNQSSGLAVAQGAVEIEVHNPSTTASSKQTTSPSIRIRTSGLTFDQKSEVASTGNPLDFLLQQGSGSAVGAVYDAAHGQLTLNSAVKIRLQQKSTPVAIQAEHAELERASQSAILRNMHAEYSSGTASTGLAHILFRADGSMATLEGSDGVVLHSRSNAEAHSLLATFQFNPRNQPQSGVMSGGTSFQFSDNHQSLSGTAPIALLHFDANGNLQTSRLQNGAFLRDREIVLSPRSSSTTITREWRSETADLQFVPASSNSAHSNLGRATVLQQIHGEGGVRVTSVTVPDAGPEQSSSLAADRMQAMFSPDGILRRVVGNGHTEYRQIAGSGNHWTSRWISDSDTLDAQLKNVSRNSQPSRVKQPSPAGSDNDQIEHIVQSGHVQVTATRAASQAGQSPTTIHAYAARSDYDGASEMLHLTGTPGAPPRLLGDNFSLTATTIDLNRSTESANAHQAVQAVWIAPANSTSASAETASPVHVLADAATWTGQTQQLQFTGKSLVPVRLWQQANSITAPTVLLNRLLQTLDAWSAGSARPVLTVLAEAPQSQASPSAVHSSAHALHTGPDSRLLRFTSGSVHESFAENLAVFLAEPMQQVTVSAASPGGPAQIQSREIRVYLRSDMPASATHDQQGLSAVDRMVCSGGVRFQAPGRTGSGETLQYTSDDATAVLQGTSEKNPQLNDQFRGTVSGRVIRFHLDNDSIHIIDAKGVTKSSRSPR